MPNTSKLSKFLKAEHCKDGDLINFIDPGIISDKEFTKDGQKQMSTVLEISVEFNGDTKTYTPNAATRGLLEAAWGFNTEAWVGKQARITIIPGNFGRPSILAKPVI